MTIAIIVLAVVLAGAVTALILALRSLDECRTLRDDYRSQRDESVRQLAVAGEQFDAEHKLRVTAELQRTAAQRRVTESLAHLPPDQIDAEVARIFGTPLSLQPGDELERP